MIMITMDIVDTHIDITQYIDRIHITTEDMEASMVVTYQA
jgi:hypothetical protein